jgi:xanthine/CO dehydrogenase XdhC/CoxF family maturation factor
MPSVASEGRARIAEYDSRSFEDLVWGLGSGCNGLVRVLLAPLSPPLVSALERARSALSAGAFVRIATVVGVPTGSEIRLGETRVLGADETVAEEPGVDVAVEEVAPPIGLLIAGCGPDAVPLARLAAELGWAVSVIAGRDAGFVHARFSGLPVVHAGGVAEAATVPVHPRTAAVVMSHNFVEDAGVLEALLPRRLPYLGVLGPRERTRRLLSACGAAGDAPSRIHSPVGLNIGAETASEIALSIVSEIQAVLAGVPARTESVVPGVRP